jgi:hypothetical protein
MPRYDALPVNLPPRGPQREVAAQYIGISVGKFDAAKEESAHRTIWKRRADFIKAIQGKTRRDLFRDRSDYWECGCFAVRGGPISMIYSAGTRVEPINDNH